MSIPPILFVPTIEFTVAIIDVLDGQPPPLANGKTSTRIVEVTLARVIVVIDEVEATPCDAPSTKN